MSNNATYSYPLYSSIFATANAEETETPIEPPEQTNASATTLTTNFLELHLISGCQKNLIAEALYEESSFHQSQILPNHPQRQ
jgi:hypothetical protein